MKELLRYLYSIKAGSVSDTARLENLLAPSWHEFDGSEFESMEGDKLYTRMEEVVWNPPILSFKIERHGATVQGSTRAGIHQWKINVKEKKANCKVIGHKQLKPMQPKLDVTPIADEIVQLIINRQKDERLKWNQDGSVRILIGTIIPEGFAFQQTLNDRRKRFRNAVDERLVESGWKKISHNRYAPLTA